MIVIGTQIKNKFSMHLHGKLIFLFAVLLHMWKVVWRRETAPLQYQREIMADMSGGRGAVKVIF